MLNFENEITNEELIETLLFNKDNFKKEFFDKSNFEKMKR
jgi:hypothetical protein